ncbi:hypothetical protein HDU76_006831, partial [Blyttiomyces sp. JEL0837]
ELFNPKGVIPDNIDSVSELSVIKLGNGGLTGVIPASIGNLSKLTILELFQNSLVGSLPESISKLTSLTELSVSHNQLSGPIPSSYSNLVNVDTFDVTFNCFTGDLPSLFASQPSRFGIGFQNADCPAATATTNGIAGASATTTGGSGTGTTAGSNGGSSTTTNGNAVTTNTSSTQAATNSLGQVNPSTTGNPNSSGSSSSSSNTIVYAGAGIGVAVVIGVIIAGLVFMKRRKANLGGAGGEGGKVIDPKVNGFTGTSTMGSTTAGVGGVVENHPWAGANAVADKSNGTGTLFGNMPVAGGVAIRQEKDQFPGYTAAAAGYGQQPYYSTNLQAQQFQTPVPQAPNYGSNVPVIPTTTATTSTFSTTSFPHDRKYNPALAAQSTDPYTQYPQDHKQTPWNNNTMASTTSSSFNTEADMTSRYGNFITWTHEILLSWAQTRLGDDALQFITSNRVDGRLLNDVLNDPSLLSSVYGVGSGRTRNEILSKAELLRGVAGGSGVGGSGSGRFGNDEPAPPNYFDHAR